MPIGAGISSSFGIATESTPGTPVAVTRFHEFNSETLAVKKGIIQGEGLRQGGRVARAARRMVVSREAGGDVELDATTNTMGVLLTHMLGSFAATPTALTGAQIGLYRQVHNPGPLAGHSFTSQIVRPDTSGVLTQEAFTYPGCKITEWALSAQQKQQVKLKLTIDALDEATPSNGFATSTLSSPTTVGGTSISTAAAIPAGAYVVLDIGVNEEVVQTSGAATGSGPYTSTLVAPVKAVHASGSYVGSATGVNYGAATAFQTASYNATTQMLGFQEGALIAGGTTATTNGIFTNTGGTLVANVRSVTITGKTPVKADRFQLGSMIRSEQIDNGWATYEVEVEVEYNGRAFYDAYLTDAPLALQLTFTAPNGSLLSVYTPAGFQDDGGQPNVGGPDLIVQKMKFAVLDDGINGYLQAVYTSTDAVL